MAKAILFEVVVTLFLVAAIAAAGVGGGQYSVWLGVVLAVSVLIAAPFAIFNFDYWLVRRFTAADDQFAFNLCRSGFVGRTRRMMRWLPRSPRCRLCLVPFEGVGRLLGIKPSGKNPQFCRSCFEGLPLGGYEIKIGVLIADIRGFTSSAEIQGPSETAAALERFYRICGEALNRRDAFVEYVGDQVMALFLPQMPGLQKRLCDVMVASAQDLVDQCAQAGDSFPIGVGLDFGPAQVGNLEKGTSKDFTAVGDVVNTAARLQSFAKQGQVVISQAVYERLSRAISGIQAAELEVRGKAKPVNAYIVSPGS